LLVLLNSNKILSLPLPFNDNENNKYQSKISISENNDSTEKYWKTFSPRFLGTLDFGRELSMPYWPKNSLSGAELGGASVNGYGFGIGIDYRPFRKLAFLFDITAH
jgi:hypothetical protein